MPNTQYPTPDSGGLTGGRWERHNGTGWGGRAVVSNLRYRLYLALHRADLAVRKRLFQIYLNSRKQKLAGADLSFLDLRGANLSGANLHEAVLIRADLSDANLRGCPGRIFSSIPAITGFSLSAQSPKRLFDFEWLIVERMYYSARTPTLADGCSGRNDPTTDVWQPSRSSTLFASAPDAEPRRRQSKHRRV